MQSTRTPRKIMMQRSVAAATAMALACFVAPALAQNAYITNHAENTVSVINTATNTVIGSPIPVGNQPLGVAVTPDGSKVYVTNAGGGTLSVINTATNTVIGSPFVGLDPRGVAVTPDGSKIYVANGAPATVSVISTADNVMIGSPIPIGNSALDSYAYGVAVTPDGSKIYVTDPAGRMGGNGNGGNPIDQGLWVISTATNKVIGSSPIPVGNGPLGVVVTPDGSKVYVANSGFVDNNAPATVSVIDTANNAVIGSIPVGKEPFGVAVIPDGSKVYVTNMADNTVSVISTATNTVIGSPIPVGASPFGVAVTPDGSKVYVVNFDGSANTVSVISTATNTVIGSPISVGGNPVAFGLFIQPAKKFAGTPGQANCHGQSVRALGNRFEGLNAAATALGYPSMTALQDAITTFCEG